MTHLEFLGIYSYALLLWYKEDTDLSFEDWLKSKYDTETKAQ